MRGVLIEKLLTAVSVCIVTATISLVSDPLPLAAAGPASRQPLARVMAVAVAGGSQLVDEVRAMLVAYVHGNPAMMMYTLASLALMLMMLRS